jgi:hypothetical protein
MKEIGDQDREDRVIDLLIEQAKNLAEMIIDADVGAERQEVQAEMRAKGKTMRGK